MKLKIAMGRLKAYFRVLREKAKLSRIIDELLDALTLEEDELKRLRRALEDERGKVAKLEEEVKVRDEVILKLKDRLALLEDRARRLEEELKGRLKLDIRWVEVALLSYLKLHQGALSISKASRDLSISQEALKEALKGLSEKGLIKVVETG